MWIRQLYAKLPTALVAGGLVVAVPAPAAAQAGVDLVPWAGVLVPTRNSPGTLVALKRDVSVIGGARLTFWGTGILGFEATGGYAPAKIGNETLNETGNTNLLVASGRLLLALSPVTNRVGFYIGAGPALLTKGKNPFNEDRSRTDFGGTAGVGFRFPLGENGSSALRLDLEDYIYKTDFGGGDKTQNDLVASLGLSLGLGGRAAD